MTCERDMATAHSRAASGISLGRIIILSAASAARSLVIRVLSAATAALAGLFELVLARGAPVMQVASRPCAFFGTSLLSFRSSQGVQMAGVLGEPEQSCWCSAALLIPVVAWTARKAEAPSHSCL